MVFRLHPSPLRGYGGQAKKSRDYNSVWKKESTYFPIKPVFECFNRGKTCLDKIENLWYNISKLEEKLFFGPTQQERRREWVVLAGFLYARRISQRQLRAITMKRILSLTLMIFGISFNSSAAVEQLAIWDFGPDGGYTETVTAENVIGIPTLELMGGEIDADGKNGVAYTDIMGIFHESGQAAAWEDIAVSSGPDAEWIVSINTTSWQGISIRFDYKAWEPGTTSFDLDYRLDEGAEWSEMLNNQAIIPDGSFHGFAYSLSNSVENQSFLQLRFYDLEQGDGNGRFAIDNFEITGTPIPEPATILLLGLGTVAAVHNRRK